MRFPHNIAFTVTVAVLASFALPAVAHGEVYNAEIQSDALWIVPKELSRIDPAPGVSYQGMQLNAKFPGLWSADLTGVDLTDAVIHAPASLNTEYGGFNSCGGAILWNATFTLEQLQSTASYQEHNLRGIIFWQTDMLDFDLSGQNLEGTGMREIYNLGTVNFEDAQIHGSQACHISGYRGTGTDFSQPDEAFSKSQLESTASYKTGDLRGAIFEGSDFSGCDFSDQNLEGTAFGTQYGGVDLTDCNFTGAILHSTRDNSFSGYRDTGAYFMNTVFTQTQLEQTASWQSHNLRGVGFYEMDLSFLDFSGQNLEGANFEDSIFSADTDFTDTEIHGTQTGQDGYRDTGTNFTGTNFSQTQLESTASWNDKNLIGVGFNELDVSAWDFSDQNLEGANFFDATVSGTDFNNATIHSTQVGIYSGYRGTGASFESANSFTQAQLESTASYNAKDLRGVTLSHLTLSSWDLSEQNLEGADFSSSSLSSVDFTDATIHSSNACQWSGYRDTGANFRSATSFTQTQLASTASYQAKDLRGVGFNSLNLSGWDLSEQNLEGANFAGATFSITTNLNNAIIHSTQTGYDGYKDTGANFSKTKNFTESLLASTASYQAKDLRGVNFSGLNLTGWDLSGQNLEGAVFGNPFYADYAGVATLTNADLSGANLSYVTFWIDYVTQVDLTGVNLTGANLNMAILPDQMPMLPVVSGATVVIDRDIQVDAGVDIEEGGTLQVGFNASEVRQITAVGDVNIEGGTLYVDAWAEPIVLSDRYTVIEGASVTGTFDQVTDNLPFYDFMATYDATHVYLGFNKRTFDEFARTPNQHSLASALDQMGTTDDMQFVLEQIMSLPTDNEIRHAYDQMTGDVYGSLGIVELQNTTNVYTMLTQQLRSTMGQGSASYASTVTGNGSIMRAQNGCGCACGCYPTWQGWTLGYGLSGAAQSDGDASGFGYSTGGLMTAMSRYLGDDANLGLFYAYDHARLETTGNTSGPIHDVANIDDHFFGVYLTQYWDCDYYILAGCFGYNDYEVQRRVQFNEIDRIAQGNHDGWQSSIYVERGHEFHWRRLALTPYTGLQYIYLRQNGVTETGADSLDLSIGGNDLNSLRTLLGTRLTFSRFQRPALPPAFELRALWLHELLDETTGLFTAQLAGGGPAFPIRGVSLGRDWAILGTGVHFAFWKNTSLYANYDLFMNSQQTFHVASGGIEIRW